MLKINGNDTAAAPRGDRRAAAASARSRARREHARRERARMRSVLLAAAIAVGNAAGALSGPALLTARAASPEFARTAEEWARLRDDVLEYEEIEDLIEEYNVTVQNSYEDWKKADSGKALEDYIEASEKELDSIYDSAAESDSELSMISADYSARMQEIQIQNTIDSAEDSTTKRWDLEKQEKKLASDAQTAMNTYYQLQYQIISAQKNRQLLDTVLANTQRQYSSAVGLATYSDVLNAMQAVQNMDAQILSLQNQQETTRQQLIVMLGWKQSAVPEIRPMPALDVNRIAAMDPAADLETAYANDYTLLAEQRKLGNSVTASGQMIHGGNVENTKQQIAVALNTAYQNVLQAKNAYDQTALGLDIASRKYALAQSRQAMGTGTAMETLQAETDVVTAQTDREVKALQLFSAMEKYDWVLKGVR